jgi:hypothetical protein
MELYFPVYVVSEISQDCGKFIFMVHFTLQKTALWPSEA